MHCERYATRQDVTKDVLKAPLSHKPANVLHQLHVCCDEAALTIIVGGQLPQTAGDVRRPPRYHLHGHASPRSVDIAGKAEVDALGDAVADLLSQNDATDV